MRSYLSGDTAWMDVAEAARYAGVSPSALLRAITAHEVRVITSHPERPGERVVPVRDVDAWWRRRTLAGMACETVVVVP